MKTAKEIKEFRDAIKKLLGRQEPLQACVCRDCFGNRVTIEALSWCLGENEMFQGEIDRLVERAAKTI